jgi:hypothetical protein
VPYNAGPRGMQFSPKFYAAGDEPMKRAVRIAVLIVGLVDTFLTATAPLVPAADGGPLLLCPPRSTHCHSSLPT